METVTAYQTKKLYLTPFPTEKLITKLDKYTSGRKPGGGNRGAETADRRDVPHCSPLRSNVPRSSFAWAGL
jgi:hypothetical protein